MPLLLGGAALALVGLGVFGSSRPASGKAQPPPVLGETSAPVLLVEYGDFQCPSCGSFVRSVEPQLRAAYIRTGKVRLEWHDFAWIGQESRDAANAARCATEQGRFWAYHDLLYANQHGENSGFLTKDQLKRFGAQLGLDATSFDSCIDTDAHGAAVSADLSRVRDLGMTATPSFLIGGQRIVGAQPFETFAAAIDAQLAAAAGG